MKTVTQNSQPNMILQNSSKEINKEMMTVIQDSQPNILLQMALIDILPNPILVKDQDLRYVLVNKAFEHLFSVSREILIGKLDT
ncbi:MAG: PAS domain-containing protein [Cyanobacteria bacterium]|nr:PAS domain-containing protein [Cyanobacteriota bacterium]MDA0866540.1 PAS domain-containing protein [Cyanobacteriota bacterium]